LSQSQRVVFPPGFRVRAAFFLLVVLGFLPAALAQPAAPPPPQTFFSDSTGAVPGEVGAQIEALLREFEKTSSNQILVVVQDRLPQGYTSLEEYTNRTAEAWRVGDKDRDNGAVLFVFVGDRKVRIEVGYGLEGALPDALASRIISDEITPQFRQNRYGDGLLAGVEAIIAATKGEYQPKAGSGPSEKARTVFFVLIVLLFLFFGMVLPVLQESSGSRTYSGRGRSRGGWGGGWGSGGGWSSGGGSWGGGGGGGFSGGGGSFGGGGASGSW